MHFYNLITEYKAGNQRSLEILLNHFDPLITKISRDLNYEEAKTVTSSL